jgi:hypothetical protein
MIMDRVIPKPGLQPDDQSGHSAPEDYAALRNPNLSVAIKNAQRKYSDPNVWTDDGRRWGRRCLCIGPDQLSGCDRPRCKSTILIPALAARLVCISRSLDSGYLFTGTTVNIRRLQKTG